MKTSYAADIDACAAGEITIGPHGPHVTVTKAPQHRRARARGAAV